MTPTKLTPIAKRPFLFAKYLSWISLILILAAGIIMAIIIGNSTRQLLLKKQQDFSLLFAENMGHQIFQRFTVPTFLKNGRIALRNKDQYEQMHTVVTEITHGQSIQSLFIYDLDKKMSYALNQSELTRDTPPGKGVGTVIETREPVFEIIFNTSQTWDILQYDLPPSSVVLRVTYPLVSERSIFQGWPSDQMMGVLEFTQDITDDYSIALGFQRIVIGVVLVTSLILFFLLMAFIRKADQINAKRMANERRLQYQLHQSERLASMGRVVAGIAHEIRNPLGIIQSSAELLLNKAKAEDSPGFKIIQVMFDEIKRLSQTVNDFLDYARPKKPHKQDVNLAMVLDQATTFFTHTAKEVNVEIKALYPEKLLVTGDKDLLYRAIYNIMHNGLQAMEDKGGTLTLLGSENSEGVSISIEDEGPGFNKDTVDKITDPFFTTKDHGTGLGLAIVNNILTGHGAEIHFSHTKNTGARVIIFFPAPKGAQADDM